MISCSGIGPFKMGRVSIEQPFLLGQPGLLRCSYDLEGSELYSVKWYKNGQEFYRFMPGMDDHTQVWRWSVFMCPVRNFTICIERRRLVYFSSHSIRSFYLWPLPLL